MATFTNFGPEASALCDELRGEARLATMKISHTGEWTDGNAVCLLGQVVLNNGGKFVLDEPSGKYVPANQHTIELCEAIIADHPNYFMLKSKFAIKRERIARAKERLK